MSKVLVEKLMAASQTLQYMCEGRCHVPNAYLKALPGTSFPAKIPS